LFIGNLGPDGVMMMLKPNLKRKDYEILKQIKDFTDKKVRILGKDFKSSTKIRRIGILKKEGYIAKEGRQKGYGTLFLTESGIQALENIPKEKHYSIQSKTNGYAYIITIKTLRGPPLNLDIETYDSPADILEAISKIVPKKKEGEA
jgi:hypothetical protein